jgi:hypothetical protein
VIRRGEFKTIMRAGPGKIAHALQQAADEASREHAKEKAQREARAKMQAQAQAQAQATVQAALSAKVTAQVSVAEQRRIVEAEKVRQALEAADAKAKREGSQAVTHWITHASGRVSPSKPVRPSEASLLVAFVCDALRNCVLSASRAAAANVPRATRGSL